MGNSNRISGVGGSVVLLLVGTIILLSHSVTGQVPEQCSDGEWKKECPHVGDTLQVGNSGSQYVIYYRSPNTGALHDKFPKITTVVIAVHGLQRDANNTFCQMNLALNLYFNGQNGRDQVLLVAPRFPNEMDHKNGSIFWHDEGWIGGDDNTEEPHISSYEVLDKIVKTLLEKTHFPSLKHIIVAGHSAGGQVVQRYALGTEVDHSVLENGITIRYIVASPSSFAYLDGKRVGKLPTKPCNQFCNTTVVDHADYTFEIPSDASTTYNNWREGLQNLNRYMKISEKNQVKDYAKKDVVYLLGGDDTCNDNYSCAKSCSDMSLDKKPDAELQGLCRYQRGWVFYKYLQQFYTPPVHQIFNVPGVPHDACGIYGNVHGRDAIFSHLKMHLRTDTPTHDEL